ncbi:aminodeoxychorismate synthase component I, partial [Massilia glaciei]
MKTISLLMFALLCPAAGAGAASTTIYNTSCDAANGKCKAPQPAPKALRAPHAPEALHAPHAPEPPQAPRAIAAPQPPAPPKLPSMPALAPLPPLPSTDAMHAAPPA